MARGKGSTPLHFIQIELAPQGGAVVHRWQSRYGGRDLRVGDKTIPSGGSGRRRAPSRYFFVNSMLII
jgi:hypothetical protein